MDGGNLAAFLNHAFGINGGCLNLAADWSVHDGGDFLNHFCKIPAFFGNQGWVGGYAADDAHVVCFSDVLYIGCVNKKFHSNYPPKISRTVSLPFSNCFLSVL